MHWIGGRSGQNLVCCGVGSNSFEKCRKSVRRPMMICKHFHYATSIEDALEAMRLSEGNVSILAGGTDLLLDLQQGRHAPVDTLVDVTNISEMKVLEKRADSIFIGAAVPHTTITTSSMICEHAQALAEASGLIGGPQVRNVATLGGNVAHALPAADGTIALMALDARVEIASPDGRRLAPLASLFKGPGKNTLHPAEELLVGFHLPTRQIGEGSAFHRIMRPQGVAIAILNCAVWLRRESDQIIDIRVSVGPSGPTPRRLTTVEEALKGQTPTPEVLQRAFQLLLSEANFRTSRHRATQDYRTNMAGVLLNDSVAAAWERAAS